MIRYKNVQKLPCDAAAEHPAGATARFDDGVACDRPEDPDMAGQLIRNGKVYQMHFRIAKTFCIER